MTPEERRRRLQEIIDQHNEAARALREASITYRAATRQIVGAHETILEVAHHADDLAEHVRQVSDAILTANEAVMALFNDDASGGPDLRTS